MQLTPLQKAIAVLLFVAIMLGGCFAIYLPGA